MLKATHDVQAFTLHTAAATHDAYMYVTYMYITNTTYTCTRRIQQIHDSYNTYTTHTTRTRFIQHVHDSYNTYTTHTTRIPHDTIAITNANHGEEP